jgi:hypothetical protein
MKPRLLSGQTTLGNFFGAHKRILYRGGEPIVECTVRTPNVIEIPTGSSSMCSKGCGKQFNGAKIRGAKATHEKSCKGTPDDSNSSSSSDSGEESDDQHEAKLAKTDRRIRNRGRNYRMRYTIMFKLNCLDQMKVIRDDGSFKQKPAEVVAGRYNVPEKTIYKWTKQETAIRSALTSPHERKSNEDYKETRVLLDSKQARRMCLGGGRGALFPLAEKKTFDEFSKLRADGLRVSPRMLSAIMKKSVRDIYGDAASNFKTSKKWRSAFAGRFGLSLRVKNNKKSTSAEARLPKIKRWYARWRRRLQSGKRGLAAVGAIEGGALSARKCHRGHDSEAIVASQGSHGIPLDCGLCALKNATSNKSISTSDALGIARAMEAKLKEDEHEHGFAPSSSRHFVEGLGDFSEGALRAIAAANNYGFFSLSREVEGECGHARQLLEFLCVLDGSRLCGVIWREGPGVVGESASKGHWISASHIHAIGDWRTHKWVIKDSMKTSVEPVTTERMIALLDGVESRRAAFGFLVDMR